MCGSKCQLTLSTLTTLHKSVLCYSIPFQHWMHNFHIACRYYWFFIHSLSPHHVAALKLCAFSTNCFQLLYQAVLEQALKL
ncbi:CLUMA_CG002981, isoform A [Clunio marinus]|uniref:CLUMA_CG002981, isoform A n=1 Tax=Clunio marinus TaxID=568069 RepID=A0A1J1HRW4_9DIPT|nr:CLUMA_CG002981, isoform A [Clunio marinus]